MFAIHSDKKRNFGWNVSVYWQFKTESVHQEIEPEKINFKFHMNWENTGEIVMHKISFCELWFVQETDQLCYFPMLDKNIVLESSKVLYTHYEESANSGWG